MMPKRSVFTSDDDATAFLPVSFNAESMYPFLGRALAICDADGCQVLYLDFRNFQFIEPVGMVVLANLIDYVRRRRGLPVVFRYHRVPSDGIRYLDDSGFFEQYDEAGRLFRFSDLRSTTMPLQRIDGPRSTEYLNFQLIPWVGRTVNQAPRSLEALRTTLEEIFHNFRDHSGVDAGCAFAQHYPAERKIQIAVADFGAGIPTVVRKVVPDADDREAMLKACEEGFTTGTNGHNRGAGLPYLIRFVVGVLKGTVLIAAGTATLVASGTAVRAKMSRGFFPGTMVRVMIPTDSLRRIASEVEPEEFEW